MTRLLLLIMVASLAACSTMAPTYKRPDAPVAATFPAGPAYKDGGNTSSPPAAEVGWRDFLVDPRLQRMVEIALANNRDLRVAALNVQQVQAQYRIQRSALYPSVAAFADRSASRNPASGNPNANVEQRSWSAGIQASWELDFFGRLRSLNQAALEQYFASGEARRAAEILLVSQVADQYLMVLAFDEQLEVTRQTLATAEASYKIVKLQFDTGTAPELSLQQALSVVEQANANLAVQTRARAQAENGLVLLLGQPMPADLPPAVALGEQKMLTDIPAGLPSDLLARRPDILQAEALLRSENANIGAARAAFFPNISLTASVGTQSAALSGLFGAGSLAWSFLPQIVAPIFQGGALRANLDVATIRKDIGIAQYEKTIQTAFREVADGLAARGTFDEQLAAQQRYTTTQQRSLELSQFRYNNGVDSYLQVLTAQTGFYNAQLALVAARQQRLTNLVDLYRALGGGWIAHTGDAPRSPES